MVHDEVRKCVKENDIKRLKYIFVDCLDVDPTFEKYQDDYCYCEKNVPDLFEEYVELTSMTENSQNWDMAYWAKLKVDLIKNFSKKRFQHMRKVVEVIHKEKIIRLKEERKQIVTKPEVVPGKKLVDEQNSTKVQKNTAPMSKEEYERQKAEDAKKIEAEWRAKKKEEEEENRRREERKQRMSKPPQMVKKGGSSSKKIMGAILIMIGVLVILLLIALVIKQMR